VYNNNCKGEIPKNNDPKGEKIMKYRVYNQKNIDERTGITFATYFKTKREAIAFAATLENAIIERKLVTSWVAC
jgi:hypothetical protein